jgi:hypothetical protein
MPDIDAVIEDMIWLIPVEIILPIEVNQLLNEFPILLKLEVIELSVDIIELTKFEIPVWINDGIELIPVVMVDITLFTALITGAIIASKSFSIVEISPLSWLLNQFCNCPMGSVKPPNSTTALSTSSMVSSDKALSITPLFKLS